MGGGRALAASATDDEPPGARAAPADDPWPAVDRLLDAYADALMRVESLPLLGRVPVRRNDKTRGAIASRWAARRFVQGHVRLQLDRLADLLRGYALRTNHAQAARTRLEHVETARAGLRGWGPIVERVRRHPLVASVLVALDVAALGLSGTNVTEPGALVSAFGAGLASAADPGAYVRLAAILLLLAVEVAILTLPPLLYVGYRPKRAIFAGGTTRQSRFTSGPLEDVDWPPLRGLHVYEAEREAFAALGARKRGELHLDLVADFGLLAVGLTAGYAAFYSVLAWRANGEIHWLSAVIAVLLAYGFLVEVRSNVAEYLDRKARGAG